MEILIFSAFFILIVKLSLVYFRKSVKKSEKIVQVEEPKSNGGD